MSHDFYCPKCDGPCRLVLGTRRASDFEGFAVRERKALRKITQEEIAELLAGIGIEP